MKEQLISFKTAKLAKEKGFELPLGIAQQNTTYDQDGDFCRFPCGNEIYYSAPTQSLLQKWLREKYNIHIEITWSPNGTDKHYYASLDYIVGAHNKDTFNEAIAYITYEEALEAGLYGALKLI